VVGLHDRISGTSNRDEYRKTLLVTKTNKVLIQEGSEGLQEKEEQK